MKHDSITVTLKGIIIGGTMLVPGLSGGSMAMLLGVYNTLISAVSSFAKHKIKSFLFLLSFAIGGSIGILLFANPLSYLIKQYPMPVLYFFLGLVAGGVPFILKQAEIRQLSWKIPLQVGLGIFIVSMLTLLPKDFFQVDEETGFLGFFLLILAGFIAAIALVLPGISVSYLLLLMGLYHETMWAISNFYLPYLLSLGIGLLLGIALTTKLLEYYLTRFPQTSYLIILGFMLGSMPEVYPGIPLGSELPLCIISLLTGFYAIQLLEKIETKNTTLLA